MSNKTQLQQNNTELQEHLQDILGLPTAAEIAAGASTGQYVWKKYQYTPEQTVTDVHMTSANITDSNKIQFVLASNMCDLTKVDASFFVGATFSVTSTNNQTFSAIIVNATKANSTSHSNYTCTLAYDPDTKTLTATIDGSTLMSGWVYSSGTFALSSATIPAQKEFIGYVVSDSSTAYPDDGEKDGYWYVKVKPVALKGWYTIDSTEGISMGLPFYCYYSSAVVLNGEIHILGSGAAGDSHKKHYKFDGTSWTSVSTLPYEFYGGSAVVFNNEIHILGGSSTVGKTKHYKFDGTSWTSVSTLPYDFYYGSAVVLNNEIHILGGSSTVGKTKHYKFDGTNWTSVSTLPYELRDSSAVVLNGEIHILSSGATGDTHKKHYKYDGTSWTSVSTLPYEFYGGSAVVLNNEIHILGGGGNNITYVKHYAYTA